MLKNLDQMQSHANYGKSAMETGDHSKNGASLKSRMSKRNLMKFVFFALTALICGNVGAQEQEIFVFEEYHTSLSYKRKLTVNLSGNMFTEQFSYNDESVACAAKIKDYKFNDKEIRLILEELGIIGLNNCSYDMIRITANEAITGFIGGEEYSLVSNHDNTNEFNQLLNTLKKIQSQSSPATPPAATSEPSGKIEKVWLEHNVYNNGEKGMNIHCHFSIDGMKGKKVVLCAFIRDSNDKSITFQCNGQSNGGSIIPPYDRSEYEDFVIFKSYSAFQSLPQGKTELNVHVRLIDDDTLDMSDYVYFSYTR
jgi:hypothetical protein